MSDRQSLVDRRTELKNRIHSVLHRNLIEYVFSDLFGDSGRANLEAASTEHPKLWDLPPLERLRIRSMLEEITGLDHRIAELEGVIAAFVVSRKQMLRSIDRLLSVSGISLVVAAGLLAAIGDISRFRKPKHLASYFGLVPSTAQTAKPKYFHGPITKRGRAQARWLADRSCRTPAQSTRSDARLVRPHRTQARPQWRNSLVVSLSERNGVAVRADECGDYLNRLSKLPRGKQEKIAAVIEAFVAQHSNR